MFKLNKNINKIEEKNEFLALLKKVKEFKKNNPDKKVLSLGVGDVSKPIIMPVIKAMQKAVEELSNAKTFKGYGDSSGYEFLKKAILDNEYKKCSFTTDEIYISGGVKTDICSILELFDINSKIYITNPVYPIYKNGSLCLNRNCTSVKLKEQDGFIPKVPSTKYDIIYLCSPNNPIGIAYDYTTLKEWVDYAKKNNAVILYDNAYYSFINSPSVPKSIYEIKDADKVAIEFRSFSKSLSFSGVRCSYYIIPNKIKKGINDIWKKRTINRFNGPDYIAQRGAEATFLSESQKEINENIKEYLNNTKKLKECFKSLGFTVYGGEDSPYLFVKIKENIKSWDAFDLFLNKLNIIITPGIIFGSEGDKFFRVSGLASKEVILEAIERIKKEYER